MAFKNDFRPDIIAGNPPYNRGMDIDFVVDAFEVSRVAVTMIVPAKWQTSEADQRIESRHSYGDFRKEIVPHMDKVVFYPDCRDIFYIFQTDGLTIYTLDKNSKFNCCKEINSSINIEEFNSEDYRNINNAETLLNIGSQIIKSMGDYESFKFMQITHSKKYEVWINTKVSGFDWYNTKEARYVISISRILNNELKETYSGEAKCIFEADTLEECYSFMSWLYSKPVRFLLVPNISKLNNIFTDHCFRFVPHIDKHTVKSLYIVESNYTKIKVGLFR